MDYRYGSHTVFKIEYHFVWVTKYRYPVLKGDVGERVRELVRQTCEAFEIRIVKGCGQQGSRPYSGVRPAGTGAQRNHEANQGKVGQQVVRGVSAVEETVLGGIFGRGGYFCATVGEMTEEMIKEYLEHHFESNPATEFKVEL